MRTNNLGRLGRRGVAATGPRPALDLNLISGSLPAEMSFSRASHATRFASDGRIELAPCNMLSCSEDIADWAYWSADRASVLANSAIAPDGTLSAAKLVEDNTSGAHRVRQAAYSVVPGQAHTFSVYLKAAERAFAQIRMENQGATQLYALNIDLASGSSSPTTFGAPVTLAASVVAAGGGWWRCSVTWYPNTSTVLCAVNSHDAFASGVYQGDGVSGLYVWGAHLDMADFARPYVKTLTLPVYSARFDHDITKPVGVVGPNLLTLGDFATGSAGWSPVQGGTISVVDGEATITSSANNYGAVQRTITGLTPGKTYRLTFTARRLSGHSCWGILLAGGQASNVSIFGSTDAEYSGTLRAGSTGNMTVSLQCQNVAGAQAAFKNVSVREVTFEPMGLLLEEQRTNINPTSTSPVGAVAASVSAAESLLGPWLTHTVTADGTNTAHAAIASSSVTPSASTLYTVSAVVRNVSGSGFVQLTGGAAWVSDGAQSYANFNLANGTVRQVGSAASNAFIQPLGDGFYRISCAITSSAAPASATAVAVFFLITGTETRSPSVTSTAAIHVGMMQLEAGGSVSSYIPTYGSAGTRVAETCTIPIGPWYDANKGTLFADVSVTEPNDAPPKWPQVVNIDDGNTADVVQLFVQTNASDVNLGMFVRSGGVTQVNTALASALDRKVAHRAAMAWQYGSGKIRGACDGGSVVSVSEGAKPVASPLVLRIGHATQGRSRRVRRIAYYQSALSDSVLQRITA